MKTTKFILWVSLLCAFSHAANAQRYLSKVFDSVSVSADIPYGFNFNYKGDSTVLYLDIYQPVGDTLQARPLVVLAHGGAFVQGNRKAADITTVCKRLAAMGYVTVSIQYRIGVNVTSGNTLEKEFQQAVWRGMQDGRAAVRYMNKTIVNGNPYKVDPNQIYAGGISAGGVLGLHLAFLDHPQEASTLAIDTNLLGGLEGNSGNPGYSWKVKGVVSLCGALANVTYMNNNKDISICNMHGTNDATVPYKTDYFVFFGADVALLQGGFSVDSAARAQQMDTRLHTFEGADHVPFSGTTPTQMLYMDTTIDYVSRYLYKHVTGLTPAGISVQKQKAAAFSSFPNPAVNTVQIAFETRGERNLVLWSSEGKAVREMTCNDTTNSLDIKGLTPGFYFLEVREGNQKQIQKLLIQ